MDLSRSNQLFKEARSWIPGGVNSPVRAYKSVGGGPIFIDHARGAKLYDVDGNEYIDYLASWGPMILGHCHPRVVDALRKEWHAGMSFAELIKHRDRLDTILQSIRSER